MSARAADSSGASPCPESNQAGLTLSTPARWTMRLARGSDFPDSQCARVFDCNLGRRHRREFACIDDTFAEVLWVCRCVHEIIFPFPFTLIRMQAEFSGAPPVQPHQYCYARSLTPRYSGIARNPRFPINRYRHGSHIPCGPGNACGGICCQRPPPSGCR